MIYDFKDNWVFKMTVAKVVTGHNDKNNDWNCNYEDFDINRINDELDKKYNMKR